ncbi:MAG: hypothetical protein JJU11_11865 [Candidatus Sumerlaeia bacterium]|nr:hypothetical protein [Candidatus Sumerlaeia bacterium]
MMMEPAWKLTLVWPGGEFVVEPEGFLGHPTMKVRQGFGFPDTIRRTLRGEFTVKLATDQELPTLLLLAGVEKALPVMAVLSLRVEPDAEWIEICIGRLHEIRRQDMVWVLRFHHGYPNGGRPLCRRRSQFIADLSDDRLLPQVFGTMWVHGVPLFHVERGQLGEDIDVAATEALLLRPVSWPPEGTVQIQDEVIGYTWDMEHPDRLQFVTRPAPREHPRGASVLRLSETPLRWCVADHPGSVEETRMDDLESGPIVDGTVEQEDAGGRDWLLFTRDALPLRVLHGRDSVETPLRDGQGSWSLTGENSSFGGNNAFPAQVASAGALLQHGSDTLEAIYTKDQSIGNRRHALVERLFLEFYFTESAFWEDGGQLQVMVGKGSRVAMINIGQGYRLEDAPAAGSADVPDKDDGFYIRWHRAPSTPMVLDGSWAIHSEIIGDIHRQGYGINQSTEVGISCGIQTNENLPEQVDRIRLSMRITNRDDADPVDIRLRIKIDGMVADEDIFTVGADSTELLFFVLEPTNPVDRADYTNAAAEYAVELPDGGDVFIETPSLEVRGAAPPAPVGVSSPLSVTALATMPIVAFRGRLEVTHLLEEGEGMAFLGPDGGSPWIRFVLAGVSPGSPWTLRLRDVQWVAELRPATSVAPSTSIHALVAGRGVGNGGLANPADAIVSMLMDPLLGGLDGGNLDESSVDDARDAGTARHMGFGAVIQGADAVSDAMETALAEGLLGLRWWTGKWRFDVYTPDPAQSPGVKLPGGSVYQPGFSTRAVHPSQSLGAHRLIRHDGIALDASIVHGVPPSPALRWLLSGSGHLVRALESRAISTGHVESGMISMERLSPGDDPVLRLPTSPVPPWRALGEVTGVELGDGVLGQEIGSVRFWMPVMVGEDAFGRWLADGGLVLLVGEGHLGSLDASGNLYIHGAITVDSGDPPPGVTVGMDGGLSLRAPDGGAWLVLEPDGSLICSHVIEEDGEMPTRMESPGYLVGTDFLALGGVAGSTALLYLDGTGIRLAGRVTAGQ